GLPSRAKSFPKRGSRLPAFRSASPRMVASLVWPWHNRQHFRLSDQSIVIQTPAGQVFGRPLLAVNTLKNQILEKRKPMAIRKAGIAKAQRHRAGSDPVPDRLVATIAPCTLRFEPNRFAALARSIISQQISTKAALAIRTRLEATLGSRGITPAGLLALT